MKREDIIKVLKDCDHLDDAIMWFTETNQPKQVSDEEIEKMVDEYCLESESPNVQVYFELKGNRNGYRKGLQDMRDKLDK